MLGRGQQILPMLISRKEATHSFNKKIEILHIGNKHMKLKILGYA